MRYRRPVLIALAAAFALLPAGFARAQQYPESMVQEMHWRMIGPFRGGRTRAAAGVPGQPNVFYIGQVDGGVWKSDDYGHTWRPIFDNEPTQSIGAIAVAPSDPEIIYVASGEGLQRPDLSVGNGIYRSTDAGKTWTHLGLRDGQQIPALAVDPHNPNRLFAAVLGHPYGPNPERGIFRSTDGGRTWKKVLYVNENTGGDDVEIDPANPNVVYATLWEARQGPWEDNNAYGGTDGGIFKSTDGGNTWHKLTAGLPKGLVQAYVAIAASEPSRLYATVATNLEGGYETGKDLGIFRSDNAGKTWYRATKDPRPAFRIGGGDLPMPKVDPKNPNVVYSGSIETWKSTDGGRTWTAIRGAPGGDDYQNMWINPNNPRIILLVADQVAIVTVNGGKTWSSWYNQPTAQLYNEIATNTFPYRVCGGQQESGSVCIESRGNDGEITFRDWHPVGVIEYGYVAPDPLDPNIIYGAGRNQVSRFHWDTGQVQNVTPIPIMSGKYRTDRTEPIIFSPVDPHVLYYAANVLFKTTDGGHSWQIISPDLTREHPGIPASLGKLASKDPYARKVRGAIYAVAPSFKNVNTIWAGTDDGLIWVTHDGGKNWKNVTPPGIAQWSKVTQLVASHFDDETAYASVSAFRIDNMRPYIYRTHDGGKTWKLITSGLPDDQPVNTVREDPVRKGLLFAGTETAVWVSFDDGGHWQSLQQNLPHTSMRDLWIHDNDLIVGTHGRSFWILDDITPLRQISAAVEHSDAYLFKPEPAYRIRRDTNTDTPLPPDTPAGKNPPDGAIIDYYLGQSARGPVTLEILDANGKVVRRYSSTEKAPPTRAELKKTALIPVYWIGMPKVLSADEGMHRWVWNLRYAPPRTEHYSYPISAIPYDTPRSPQGPLALPGHYTVRLVADGHTYSEPLTITMDPRVKTPFSGLAQAFQMETRLVSMMNGSYKATGEARALSDDLAKISKQASGSVARPVSALQKKVAAILKKPDDAEPETRTGPPTLPSVTADASSLFPSFTFGRSPCRTQKR
ncbi:MAG: glycoside hydrolase [Acidobacteriota bacterium]